MSSIIAGFALQAWRSFPASPPRLDAVRGPGVPAPVRWLAHVPSDLSRCPFRASVLCAPARRAPSPASLGPCDANGEARAVNRHGTSPLASSRRSAENQPVFCRPAATPEQECHKAPAALGTQVAVYEDSIGQLILQWLRKPEYWSEGSSGTQALWHAYTPEPVTPSELALSRQACGVACDAQPVIKGTLPNRDIAHMAATSLGYLTWGVTNDPMDYGLGDLGGWVFLFNRKLRF